MVSSWNFESWNEPDHKDFGGVNMTIEGVDQKVYRNYTIC